MKTRNYAINVGCVIALCGSFAMGQTPPVWNHNPTAQNGPLHWGGVTASYATCGNAPLGLPNMVAVGKTQTPVDIVTANTVLALLPQIDFEYNNTAFEVENTGHVVEVLYAGGSSIRLGDSVTDIYQLVQFHFHAPSEHTTNGKQYDAEVHLVHQNALGQLALVGVLLSMSPTAPSSAFDDIVMTAPMTVGTGQREGVFLSANSLLPADQDYFTYAGSLTTPPCSEGGTLVCYADIGVSLGVCYRAASYASGTISRLQRVRQQ